MESLLLHDLHGDWKARFEEVSGHEVVSSYGDVLAEHKALRETAGLVDLSFRGRLCLTGADQRRFLHGQVTNDVNALGVGDGGYAALVTAKGKMVSDLNIYRLENELLLDFEPSLTAKVQQRLEHYIIADDVQVMDVAPHYGLLSLQGAKAGEVVRELGLAAVLPEKPFGIVCERHAGLGEIYVANQPRFASPGFDLFIPNAALEEAARKLAATLGAAGGRPCGWQACEIARIEAGLPRYGADMDESNLPPEAGLEKRAVSLSKGCYIGQEVINRVRTYGQVAKALRGLRLPDELGTLPEKGDKLFQGEKEVGFVTSALASPTLHANIALGYVRREANGAGTELTLRSKSGHCAVRVQDLPWELEPKATSF